MNLLRLLERIAQHRMPADERRRQEAFLDEMEARWTPQTAADRKLDRRSHLVHLATSLTAGEFSLMTVGFAAIITTIGALTIGFSPAPSDPNYEAGSPLWAQIVLALAIAAFGVESLRFPRIVRRRFAVIVSLPLMAGMASLALMMRVVIGWDLVLRISLVGGAIGAFLALIGSLTTNTTLARLGIRGLAITALGTGVSDTRWAAVYYRDGDTMLATGCLISAIGLLLMLNGLLLAKPDAAVRIAAA